MHTTGMARTTRTESIAQARQHQGTVDRPGRLALPAQRLGTGRVGSAQCSTVVWAAAAQAARSGSAAGLSRRVGPADLAGRRGLASLLRAHYRDAAYFNYAFLAFVRDVLHASVNVDYNLRRRGKRFLADLFFLHQWRDLMRPRSNIERHFAWMKRYSGLKYFRVQGYLAVTQFVFRVYIAALIAAFIAARHQRPELATSRLKVLAFVNT